MRRTLLLAALAVAGCATGETIGSGEAALAGEIDGDFVMAPEVAAHPISAAAIPAGVEATPIRLVRVYDDLILACASDDAGAYAIGGFDPVDDGSDGGGFDPGLRPERSNAPLRSDDLAGPGRFADAPAPTGMDLRNDETRYQDNSQVGTNLERLRPLPENVWLWHAGCL